MKTTGERWEVSGAAKSDPAGVSQSPHEAVHREVKKILFNTGNNNEAGPLLSEAVGSRKEEQVTLPTRVVNKWGYNPDCLVRPSQENLGSHTAAEIEKALGKSDGKGGFPR